MKKFINYSAIFILLLSFALITSCTKEGPAGPAGPAGNANVKTMEISIYSYEWSGNSTDGYDVDKECSIITEDIVKNGSVNVFLEIAENYWLAIPYQGLVYGYKENTLSLYTSGSPSSTYKFKVVAIAGNMVSKSNKINFKNYNELKNYYHLSN